jgi:hypothetical protein
LDIVNSFLIVALPLAHAITQAVIPGNTEVDATRQPARQDGRGINFLSY